MRAQDTTVHAQAEQFVQQYRFFNEAVITQPLRPLARYAQVEGGYRQTGGGYMLAQDAAKQNEYFFQTAGTRTIKKWLVSGAFSYRNIRKDSVGYTLRDALQDPAPYYFYAGKKGNWQSIGYDLQGILSRPFLHERFTAAAGIDYHSDDGWRSNDPRPEYFTYRLGVNASLLYKLLPGHQLGLGGGIIRRNSDSNIEYRKKDYQYSYTQPEYITYLQDGYGYIELKSGSSTDVASDTKGWKWNAVYDGHFGIGSLTLEGGHSSASSRFYDKGLYVNEQQFAYGYFHEDEWTGSAYWQYKQGAQQWSATLHYSKHEGRDYNTLLAGNNYVYSLTCLRAQPMYAHYKNQRLQYELCLDAAMTDLYRADGSAGQTAEYQYAAVGALAAWYVPVIAGHNTLKLLLGVQHQLPVSTTITQPAQQPDFTKAVIFRDYYYYHATVNTWRVESQYLFSVHTVRAFVKAGALYHQAALPTFTVPASSLPGTVRWQWQLSTGINF
ncbi:hypothetical protein GA0116948_11864 [Chitinophaga costaii]|uniref:DUF6850 domain-containing protein n=2 Tax=Chitinophaga costaii TaxID=1335309 RepID=A0A1C4FZ40_9BACT|nr:hypothetical protein DCM91_17555 [Chitinophaga costaii]SCC61142.1 hypothetical protein GA0116948_11864 [Chitinophaga costaii]